jgi:RNA polymerase sigma-70 factor (ECF subfamily)
MKLDEKLLISGLQQQNKVIFDLVFTYYYSGLCAFANHILKDMQASEDLVQDFFVKIWHQADKIQINCSLKSYFFSSIKNRAFDILKHKKVKTQYANLNDGCKESVTPDEIWEFTQGELEELIEKALQQVPPRAREIFELSRFKGVANDDIARQLNISKRTVEVQISRALQVLRVELKDYLPLFMILLQCRH